MERTYALDMRHARGKQRFTTVHVKLLRMLSMSKILAAHSAKTFTAHGAKILTAHCAAILTTHSAVILTAHGAKIRSL